MTERLDTGRPGTRQLDDGPDVPRSGMSGPSGGAGNDGVAAARDVVASRSQLYKVRFLEPLLDRRCEALLAGGTVPGRRFVVIDDGVPHAWRIELAAYLASHGVEARVLVMRGGEEFKTMDTVAQVVRALEEFGLDRRNEPIIIVGGGAVLDTGGLAAGLYRRGVPYIRVPSTLLAYVDASIGIKTGVNFGGVKNLVGAFAPPKLVLLDRTLLQSLPAREIASGLGEILKIAFGCDSTLFRALEQHADAFLTTRFSDEAGLSILTGAIDAMIRELKFNLYEDDLSRAVDLGHTFSQPFELVAGGDELRHGEAVGIDLNLSAVISYRRGLLTLDEVGRLQRLTRRLGLRLIPPDVSPEVLWQSIVERTRHRAGRQRLPLPFKIGACTFVDDLRVGEVTFALSWLAGTSAE